MNIKKRVKVNQPEEYQKLQEKIQENNSQQNEPKSIQFLLWMDDLMDKPVQHLLKIRNRFK